MQSVAALPEFFAPDVIEDPFGWYRHALAQAPMAMVAGGTVRMVLSHQLVAEAASRPADFSSNFRSLMGGQAIDPEIAAIEARGFPQIDTLLTADPPIHTRFRKLASAAFSLPRIKALHGEILCIVDDLLDGLVGRDHVELVHEFAAPLPIAVIARQVGMEEDASSVKRWSDAFADRLGGMAGRERELECAREIVEFQHAVKRHIDIRRDGKGPDDLLSALVNARIDGEIQLRDEEIISVVQQLMVAGNETTTSTIAAGLVLLVQVPEQLKLVREDCSLRANMVEEMLRLSSPTAGIWRIATQDTELGGVAIRKNEMLMLRFAAANRDPAVFPDPDRFDVRRENARDHVAFGYGIHRCIGHMLARSEILIAFDRIIDRFDQILITQNENEFRHSPNKLLRGLINLSVKFK